MVLLVFVFTLVFDSDSLFLLQLAGRKQFSFLGLMFDVLLVSTNLVYAAWSGSSMISHLRNQT